MTPCHSCATHPQSPYMRAKLTAKIDRQALANRLLPHAARAIVPETMSNKPPATARYIHIEAHHA